MPAVQTKLFSDGSLMTVKSKDAPWSVAATSAPKDVFLETRATVRAATECESGKSHSPIKLNTRRHPDQSYWCTRCGLPGLPAPERKPWE